MSTIQSDGISPVTSTSTRNNRGTLKANGSIFNSNFNSSNVIQSDVGVFSSSVVDNDEADKALSDGVFGFNNNRPIGKKITSSLSQVSNNYLLSGSSNPGGVISIHKIEGIKTRQFTKAIREDNYDIYTNQFAEGYPQITDDSFGVHNPSIPGGVVDTAANPTREIPGKLFYRTGAPSVNADQYKRKTN